MVSDFRMEDLSGLDEGLRVRHISNSPLVTCKDGEDLEEAFRRPDYKDLDQLPIMRADKIIAIAERSNSKARRALDDSVLVSADSPLSNFIHTVHKQPYRLVVDGTGITGIVTWSDLLKLPVTVLAFSLIAQLELAMNSRVKEKYGNGNGWRALLNKKGRARIDVRKRKLSKENLVLPDIELADLVHKAKVLRELLSTGRNFNKDLQNIARLRNDVAHVKDMIRNNTGLKIFVERIETARAWLKTLQGEKASSAAVP